jgi:hypothetical protein
MQNNDCSKPRKRIMVLPGQGGDSSVVREALGKGDFELKFVSDLSRMSKAVLELKPALLLMEIDSWQKQTKDLLCELGNLKSTQPFRKVILSGQPQ